MERGEGGAVGELEAPAQINSPERHIIVFGFRPEGAESYEKLKGYQLTLKDWSRKLLVCEKTHTQLLLHDANLKAIPHFWIQF